jgi:hypothetical protein
MLSNHGKRWGGCFSFVFGSTNSLLLLLLLEAKIRKVFSICASIVQGFHSIED